MSSKVAAAMVLFGQVLVAKGQLAELLPDAIWPLCGHVSAAPPVGWDPTDPRCPQQRLDNPGDYTDAPLSSTFGPRQQASQDFRYDFHRGIDIPSANDQPEPVFAVADGVICLSGLDRERFGPSDIGIRIEHGPTGGRCVGGETCVFSQYLHLSSVRQNHADDPEVIWKDPTVPAADRVPVFSYCLGAVVRKGDFIGMSGQGVNSGFDHLHFEVLLTADGRLPWRRHAIHPLNLMPYPQVGFDRVELSLDEGGFDDPANPVVSATVSLPQGSAQAGLDLNRIELRLLARDDIGWRELEQGMVQATPGTPDTDLVSEPQFPLDSGYVIQPGFYDMQLFNRQYSYEDSATVPWQSFQDGGVFQSPFASDLLADYDAMVHMDQALGVLSPDSQVGQFNGLLISPARFNKQSGRYQLTVVFEALTGDPTADLVCAGVRAVDIHGGASAMTYSSQCEQLIRDGFE